MQCSFIINMLPIYPLDGGRILKNILLYKTHIKQTIKTMETISKYTLIILSIFASILILSFKNISIFILVIYLWGIYIKERHKKSINKKSISNNRKIIHRKHPKRCFYFMKMPKILTN